MFNFLKRKKVKQ